MDNLTCFNCNATFSSRCNLLRHQRNSKRCERKGEFISYTCTYCDFTTNDKTLFKKHCKTYKCQQKVKPYLKDIKLSESYLKDADNCKSFIKGAKKQIKQISNSKTFNTIKIKGQLAEDEKIELLEERITEYKEKYNYYMNKYNNSKHWIFCLFQKQIRNYLEDWINNLNENKIIKIKKKRKK